MRKLRNEWYNSLGISVIYLSFGFGLTKFTTGFVYPLLLDPNLYQPGEPFIRLFTALPILGFLILAIIYWIKGAIQGIKKIKHELNKLNEPSSSS